MLQVFVVLEIVASILGSLLDLVTANWLILVAVVGGFGFLLWTGTLGEWLAAGWDWLAAFGTGLWNWFVDQLAADLNPFAGAPALG